MTIIFNALRYNKFSIRKHFAEVFIYIIKSEVLIGPCRVRVMPLSNQIR